MAALLLDSQTRTGSASLARLALWARSPAATSSRMAALLLDSQTRPGAAIRSPALDLRLDGPTRYAWEVASSRGQRCFKICGT